jgi:predicted transcriptional regulator
MPTTTLRVTSDLKDRLDRLKVHPRETYNDLLERLIAMAIDGEPLSDEAIQGLEEALEDIKAGRIHSEDEILREFEL